MLVPSGVWEVSTAALFDCWGWFVAGPRRWKRDYCALPFAIRSTFGAVIIDARSSDLVVTRANLSEKLIERLESGLTESFASTLTTVQSVMIIIVASQNMVSFTNATLVGIIVIVSNRKFVVVINPSDRPTYSSLGNVETVRCSEVVTKRVPETVDVSVAVD